MIRVKNKEVIRRLTNRSIRKSAVQNIIAVMAIALTTLLFTSLFTVGSGMFDTMRRADQILSGGQGHANIRYMTESEYMTISSHPLVQEMAYCMKLADSVDNSELMKRYTEIWYYDETGLNYKFMEPTGGHKPQEENEIIADTKTLQLLGVPLEEGQRITLELTVCGEPVSRDFVLAGWWESYPGVQTGTLVTSLDYVERYMPEPETLDLENATETGTITGLIQFTDILNVEENLNQVILESGFSTDIHAENYLDTGINPFYLSLRSSSGTGTAAALICAMLLFAFTGYLIIYNIFQISVFREIRYYGLLKTIGTTKRQIRAIVRRQSLILSCMGIPVGLCGGFFTGKALLPVMTTRSGFTESVTVFSPRPLIFAGAAAFSLITVLISTRKPAKIASKVTPMEAISYNELSSVSVHKRSEKKSHNGGTPSKMAWSNLGQNKRRTVMVILSLSLSIVLTHTIFNLSQSVDENKVLQDATNSDFKIAHANFFNYLYSGLEANGLTERFITAVEEQEGFQSGGRQYGLSATYTSQTTSQDFNEVEDGVFVTSIYGLEDFSFSRLELIDGQLDLEKLATGKYVLEGIWSNTRGTLDMDSMNHQVGDIVKIFYEGNILEMTVIGHVVANETNSYGWTGSSFFLPADTYCDLTGRTDIMSYTFDVDKEHEAEIEEFLKYYTETIEPVMDYESRTTLLAGITDIRDTLVIIGSILALIIGLIGILNFINTMTSSILTRQRELAMLRSIGMTNSQLAAMLCYEGTYYAALTSICSLSLSLLSSHLIIRPIGNHIWFLNHSIELRPILIILPVLFLLSIFTPYIINRITEQHSIVERLRTNP